MKYKSKYYIIYTYIMDNSLSWFASENPEQIQKMYNIINHKSVNDFYLFHNTIATSSEILYISK